ELRAVNVVRLEQNTVLSGGTRSRRPRASGGCVQGGIAVGDVAVALTEPDAVLTMLSYNLKVDVLAEVELPDEALATERLVADGGVPKKVAAGGEPGGGSLADHGIETNSLDPGFARVEGLAGGKESGIAVAVGQAHASIVGAKERCRIASPIVPG